MGFYRVELITIETAQEILRRLNVHNQTVEEYLKDIWLGYEDRKFERDELHSRMLEDAKLVALHFPRENAMRWNPARLTQIIAILRERRMQLLQEESLDRLKSRLPGRCMSTMEVRQIQGKLRELWEYAFPNEELIGLISDQWERMGWKGNDPSKTLYARGGLMAVDNLLFFAKRFPESFKSLVQKQPCIFASAGVNITVLLIEILDLESGNPQNDLGKKFVKLLTDDEWAFDMLHCITLNVLVREINSYQCGEPLIDIRRRVEMELLHQGVERVEDMASRSLLM